jgi:hypothetical protein
VDLAKILQTVARDQIFGRGSSFSFFQSLCDHPVWCSSPNGIGDSSGSSLQLLHPPPSSLYMILALYTELLTSPLADTTLSRNTDPSSARSPTNSEC